MLSTFKRKLSDARSRSVSGSNFDLSTDNSEKEEDEFVSKSKEYDQEIVHGMLMGIKHITLYSHENHINMLSTKHKHMNNTNIHSSSTSSIVINEKECQKSTKLIFPTCGSDNTPSHIYHNFDFEEYASTVFAMLRIRSKIESSLVTQPFVYLYKLFGISINKQMKNRNNNNLISDVISNYSSDLNILHASKTHWQPLITNSKSGQLFFRTSDGLFIIKSVTKSECNFIRRFLMKYYTYMMANSDTLISPFLGLYKLNIQLKKAIYFIVQKSVLYMANPERSLLDIDMNCNEYIMHKVYDIKGSTFGRQATRWRIELTTDEFQHEFANTPRVAKTPETSNIETQEIANEDQIIIMSDIPGDGVVIDIKSNDDMDISDSTTNNNNKSSIDDAFSPSFYVPEINDKVKVFRSESLRQRMSESDRDDIQTGVVFKRSKILKDLDFKNDDQTVKIGSKRKTVWIKQLKNDLNFLTELNVMDYSLLVGIHYKTNAEMMDVNHDRWAVGQLFTYDNGGMSYHTSDDDCKDVDDEDVKQKNAVYFCGIIDILQRYNNKKKLETFVKSFQTKTNEISSVEPAMYANRMLMFLEPNVQ